MTTTSQNTGLTAQVDDLFSTWDRMDAPGAALAVVQDGEIVYERGYGMANLEYVVPITPSTIFHVASLSKQFTSFAITLLALEAGYRWTTISELTFRSSATSAKPSRSGTCDTIPAACAISGICCSLRAGAWRTSSPNRISWISPGSSGT
jgi:hypothetical protein